MEQLLQINFNCYLSILETEEVDANEEEPVDPADPADPAEPADPVEEDDDDDNDVIHTPAPSRPTSSTSRRTHAESVKNKTFILELTFNTFGFELQQTITSQKVTITLIIMTFFDISLNNNW